MANLFSTIKSIIVEAYAVVCLSINPVVVSATATVEEEVVSEASNTVTHNVAAAVAVSNALVVADTATKYCDTLEGYQEYCAAVQRLFSAEDAMLEAAGLAIPEAVIPVVVDTVKEVVGGGEEYDAEADEAEYYAIAIKHPELAAIAKAAELVADEAAHHCDTIKGYNLYHTAVQRFFAARDAVWEAEAFAISSPTSTLEAAVEAEKVALEAADKAAELINTPGGYPIYCLAVQRLFSAEDAVRAAQAEVDAVYITH